MKQVLSVAMAAMVFVTMFAQSAQANIFGHHRRVVKPIAKPVAKPVVNRIAKPIANPAVKPVPAKPVAKPAPVKPAPVKPAPVAGRGVVDSVSKQLQRMRGLSTSFCFAVENGAVTGVDADKPVRTASVTKTITTFWAINSYGPNYQYKTKFTYQASNKELHISGSYDPFFDRDRIYVLLADLNKKGIKEISRLTFEKNFWLNTDANNWRYKSGMNREHVFMSELHPYKTAAGDMDQVKGDLEVFFNTSQWTAEQKKKYALSRSMNSLAGLPSAVSMKTDSVALVPSNPLSGKPDIVTFEAKSAPLKMYLKEMNIHSINPYADELFFSLGGKEKFDADMAKLGYGDQLKGVLAGSGVNLVNGPSSFQDRGDSMISCSTVVRLIRRLDQQLEAMGLDLSDVMAAPGMPNENATWQDPTNSLVVKTGTMKNPFPLRNLAGVEETRSGEVYFGIFIDGPVKRGQHGHSGEVTTALTAMNANHFQRTRVTESKYAYQPIKEFSHLAPSQPTAPLSTLAPAKPASPVVNPPQLNVDPSILLI